MKEERRLLGVGGLIRRTWTEARRQPGALVVLAVALVLSTAFSIGEPVIWKINVEQAVDSARRIAAGEPAAGSRFALTVAISVFGFVVLGLVQWVGSAVANGRAARMASRIANELRLRAFGHLLDLSMAYFARTTPADLVGRIGTDLDVVEDALARALPGAATAALTLVFATVAVALLDWRFGLVYLLVGLALVWGWRRGAGRIDAAYERERDAARIGEAVEEAVAGQAAVKALVLRGPLVARFRDRIEQATHDTRLPGALGGAQGTFGIVAITTFFGANMLLSVGLFVAGALPRGVGATFIAIGLFIRPIVGAMQLLTNTLPSLQRAAAALQRVDELLAERPTVPDIPGALTIHAPTQEIRLENVSFGYTPDQPVLGGLDVTIPIGQFVAFVGPSGAGKSTLVNLLTRLYDPTHGKISADGQDFRGVKQASLREHFGVVLQETFLFDDTIRDNIRLGRPSATDAEVEAAAREAALDGFLATLPQGLDTPIGPRGGRLSAGQRQRVALARALVRRPAVLILDEATSALDPGIESDVVASLSLYAASGHTVIAIGHRLATITRADCIHVIDGGRIVESGRHDELMGLGGVYARLWQKQHSVALDAEGVRARVDTAALRTIPVLEGLDDALLARVAARFVTETIAENRLVVHQGDEGDKFYVVARGALSVTQREGDGERPLRVLRDGDHFGEIALLRNVPRTATVRSLTPCVLLSLQRGQFFELIEQAPELRAQLDAKYAGVS